MKYLILYLGVITVYLCNSQLIAQHGASLTYAPSKVIKHRSSLLFDVPNHSHEFRLAYTYQTSGKHEWEQFWGKPRITINGLYVNYGNKEVLGNAYALLPELHFVLKTWKKLRLNLQFGTGIAYLNKPYNAISNPTNNAIGSFLNNITSLKFGLAYEWDDRWITTVSTGLVHFSNGLSSSPNSGINIYGVTLGGVYRFGDKETITTTEDLLVSEPVDSAPKYRRWIVDAQYHYGFTEYTVPDGPKYAVHAYSLGGGYRYNAFMTVMVGAEYEFNEGKYTFFKRNFYTEEEALDRARSSIIYVENELRFGHVFNRLRFGFYLPYPIENTKSVYTKVVTGLYLPEIKGYARPYIGVLLKTHTAVADYLGILMGVSI